jgi:hypothetical protein
MFGIACMAVEWGYGTKMSFAHEEEVAIDYMEPTHFLFLPLISQGVDANLIDAEMSDEGEGALVAASGDCPAVSTEITPSQLRNVSDLWGEAGELWNPLGRLPDFSYAGYHGGNLPLPTATGVILNVRQKPFYAAGDGVTDDTVAFQRVLAAAQKYRNGQQVVIYVPAGRYLLTNTLQIQRSNTILRGVGGGEMGADNPAVQSILHFKVDLETARDPGHSEFSHWSYGDDGMLQVGVYENDDSAVGHFLTSVTRSACRGERQLMLNSASNIRVGSYIMLKLEEEQVDGRYTHSLWQHFHNYQASPPKRSFEELWPVYPYYWIVQVVSKTSRTVTLAQPLRHDVLLAWKPELYTYHPVQEVGIEHLRIMFDDLDQRNHHNTRADYGIHPLNNQNRYEHIGNNGIGLRGVLNSWIMNVTIANADNALSIGSQSKHNTVQGLWIKSRSGSPDGDKNHGNSYFDPPPPNSYYNCYKGTNVFGHHGLLVTIRSHDNLITDFEIDKPWSHDTGFMHLASGNVIRKGRGFRMSIGFFTDKAIENLYSNIHVGDGIKWNFASGSLGPKSGARATYWNIQANNWKSLGSCGQPQPRIWQTSWRKLQSNLIGGSGGAPLTGEKPEWNEPIRGTVSPAELYESQMNFRRLSGNLSVMTPPALDDGLESIVAAAENFAPPLQLNRLYLPLVVNQ